MEQHEHLPKYIPSSVESNGSSLRGNIHTQVEIKGTSQSYSKTTKSWVCFCDSLGTGLADGSQSHPSLGGM